MIRAQKVDLTILGAMEVSENGDIANWKIPGKMVKGMGGAMVCSFCEKYYRSNATGKQNGESKLLQECTLPLTGVKCIKKIVTELGVYEVLPEGGFKILERAPGVSMEEIKAATAGKLYADENVRKWSSKQ